MTSRTIQQLDPIITPVPATDLLPVGQADGTTKNISSGALVKAGLQVSGAPTLITPVVSQGVTLTYSGAIRQIRNGYEVLIIGGISFTVAGTVGQTIFIALPVAPLVDAYGCGSCLGNVGGTYVYTFGRISGGGLLFQELAATNFYGQAGTVAVGQGLNFTIKYIAATPA